MPNPTNIYILHDPKDHVFLNSLETQMNVLKQQGVISIWSSSDLIAGSEVEKITSQKIADADLVLALVSADYLASADCQKIQKQANDLGKAIIPIIIRPCLWQIDSLLSKLSPTPLERGTVKEVNTWHNQDEAFAVVVRRVMEVALAKNGPDLPSIKQPATTWKPSKQTIPTPLQLKQLPIPSILTILIEVMDQPNSAILLSSRWENNELRQVERTIDERDYGVERSRIQKAVLELIDRLDTKEIEKASKIQGEYQLGQPNTPFLKDIPATALVQPVAVVPPVPTYIKDDNVPTKKIGKRPNKENQPEKDNHTKTSEPPIAPKSVEHDKYNDDNFETDSKTINQHSSPKKIPNLKPTLIIGLGTSGLRVLEHFQDYSFENLGQNKPENVEYLYIETRKDALPRTTKLRNEIRRTYTSLFEMNAMIRQLKENPNVTQNWLPPETQTIHGGIGAGGVPAWGRLALWGTNNYTGDNFMNVTEDIKHAYSKLVSRYIECGENDALQVFITGSLAGGTCTGMFIDIAYLVRHLIQEVQIFSLLLLPPKPISFSGNEIMYCNALGALRALEHYDNPENVYKATFNNKSLEFSSPPFDFNQIISQSYNAQLPDLKTLNDLYQLSGLSLFLNIMGLGSKRTSQMLEAISNWTIGRYSTFGLSTIQYPIIVREIKKIAQRSEFYMLPIRDKTLELNRHNPRVIIGPDQKAINKVMDQLKEENFWTFDNTTDHVLEIKFLKKIMIFYIEQTGFEPLEDITYMEDVKRLYEEYPKKRGGMVEKYWDNFRTPYLNQT